MIGFDREGPPHPPEEAELIHIDLSSEEDVTKSLQAVKKKHGNRFACVVHLAAYYSFTQNESPLYEEITIRGTERLLKGLQEFEVEQFLFSSTMLVHATCRLGERINESWRLAPKWAYPQSKVKTEHAIERLRRKMPAVILRISGIYDDQCRSIPIAHQIQRIYEKEFTSHFFPGNMDHGQSFMHLDDLIDVMEILIEKRKQLPESLTCVLGEEETLSFRQLQNTFGHLLHGRDWPTFWLPKWFAKLGAWLQMKLKFGDPFIKPWMIDLADDHYALDISRIKSHTQWQPKRSLKQTLPKMIEALKKDPATWYKVNKLQPTRDVSK
jgi:nucleoside-diphosphate-sugar epimerase